MLDPALNKRFLYLASPLVVQYAMQNWAWFVIQMIMSSECEDLASAYGEHDGRLLATFLDRFSTVSRPFLGRLLTISLAGLRRAHRRRCVVQA